MSVLRSLAVFFSLGALLFLGTRLAEREPPVRVVVPADATDAQIAAAKREAVLVRQAKRIGALRGDPALVQWITEALPEDRRTREDILAMLDMGLEERDPVIRRRLVYWAERVLEREADDRVTEADLRAHLEAFPERFVRPARTRLELVYFSRARRGLSAERDAREAELPDDPSRVGEAYRKGDPHMHLRPLVVATDDELSRRFGPEVAAAAGALEPGRWSSPVETETGLFRVRVIERAEAGTPSVEEAFDAIRVDLVRERRAAALREGVARLLRETEFEVVRR